MKNLLRTSLVAVVPGLAAGLAQAHELGGAHSHMAEGLFLGFIFLTVCGGLYMLYPRR